MPPGGAQRLERDDEAVEGAEALAVIGVGVVEAARERARDAVVERGGRRPRSRRRSSARTDGAERRRPRELLRLGERARLAGARRRRRTRGVWTRRSSSSVGGGGSSDPRRQAAREDPSATSANFLIGITCSPSRRRESGVVVGGDHAVVGGSSRKRGWRAVHAPPRRAADPRAAAGDVHTVHRVDRVDDRPRPRAAGISDSCSRPTRRSTSASGHRLEAPRGDASAGAEVGLRVGRGAGIDLAEPGALVGAQPRPRGGAPSGSGASISATSTIGVAGRAAGRGRAAPRRLERERAQPRREAAAAVRGLDEAWERCTTTGPASGRPRSSRRTTAV